MRVVFDAEPLFPIGPGLGPTGVGRWTKGAIKALAQEAPDWEILLLAMRPDGQKIEVSDLGANVGLHVVRMSPRTFRRMNLLRLAPPVEKLAGRADAVVGTNYIPMRSKSAAEVPVVYDLSFIHEPKTVSRRNLAYLKVMLPRSLSRAGAVVTISETMRDEISTHYGFHKDRIIVAPPGCDPKIYERAPSEGQIPRPYFLSVATLEPRKNLQRLVSAHSSLRRKSSEAPVLVIAGGHGWRMAEPGAMFREALERGDLILRGFVTEDELAGLYRYADALVFPSLYEGFGLPIIEAMAAGCPVITSDRSGMAEVAGDAALAVDPLSEADIAEAMNRLAEDPTLRAELVIKGKRRAEMFPWSKTGTKLKEAILAATS